MEIDPDRVIANPDLSVMDGALAPWGEARGRSQWFTAPLRTLARRHGFKLDTPWRKLPASAKRLILYGSDEELKVKYTRWDDSEFYWKHKFEGLMPNLLRLYHETESESRREWIERFMTLLPCPDCQGQRLKPEALAVRIGDLSIADLSAFSIRRCHDYFARELKLSGRDEEVSREVVKELRKRLSFLTAVGIDYLTLDRTAETLGGGEAQRVRLATQIGSGLVGVVYILDARGLEGETWSSVLILLNGEGTDQTFALPPGRWHVLADADRAATAALYETAEKMKVLAHSGMVLYQ